MTTTDPPTFDGQLWWHLSLFSIVKHILLDGKYVTENKKQNLQIKLQIHKYFCYKTYYIKKSKFYGLILSSKNS